MKGTTQEKQQFASDCVTVSVGTSTKGDTGNKWWYERASEGLDTSVNEQMLQSTGISQTVEEHRGQMCPFLIGF